MVGSPENGIARNVEYDIRGLSETHAEIIAAEYDLGIVGATLQGELSEERDALASADIDFAAANPSLPAENVVSRLDNYKPKNASQEVLLGAARRLVHFRSLTRLAGLIVCGPPGIGKTHIAVGVAKLSLSQGQVARYINVSNTELNTLSTGSAQAIARESDIVIVDDLNETGIPGGSFFRTLIAGMHDRGSGKLLVTSNFGEPQQLIDSLTTGTAVSPTDSQRLRDRIGSSLMGITVEGDSYRRASQVDQAPWWLA